jgi:hypothetical protein
VDFQLTGLVIVAAVAAPYVIEILYQVPLLTRLISALPPDTRARLGRHPRDPRLGIFGSTRFFLRLFRYTLRADPNDDSEMMLLKRQARRSGLREGIFGVLLLTTVLVLWFQGWRPPWPAP